MASIWLQIFSRWFALLSAVFATLAWKSAYDSLGHTSSLSVKEAAEYTACLLGVFAVLAAASYRYKKQLDAASQLEEKEGVLELTPSELLALTVDDGISNLTSAMASILAGLWLALVPSMSSSMSAAVFLGAGSVVLLIEEALRRSLQKGSLAEYIVIVVNGLTISTVSWWVGYPLSKFIQGALGAPAGESAKIQYWMWGVAFLAASVNMEILSFIATKLPKGADGKVYGNSVLRMLKGLPLYASGLILYNITQFNFKGNYLVGTLIWLSISSVVLVGSDQLMHLPGHRLSPARSCAAEKDVAEFSDEALNLMGQTLSYVCGQLGASALAALVPGAHMLVWLLFSVAFQVVSLVLQDLRTSCLPVVFKTARSYVQVGLENSQDALKEAASSVTEAASSVSQIIPNSA